MARRLAGDESTGWRSTDHTDEMLELVYRGTVGGRSRLEELADRCAIDLLLCHDETGISLDDWPGPRALVEHVLGKPILENGV